LTGSPFKLIAQGVDVSGINRELENQPHLWNRDRFRTESLDSPHHGISDIWCRWRDPRELTSAKSHHEPHAAVNWPAWDALPSLHPLVRNLSHVVDATHRGGILITKTPPMCQVKPHVDTGWHARFYETKLYIVLRSNPLCLNTCGDAVENFREGDVWQYPNNILHSVLNNGHGDHVNVIVCLSCK
jgi:hypothetical protein